MYKVDIENCYFYKSDDGGLRIDPKDGEVKIYTKEEFENDLIIVGTESNIDAIIDTKSEKVYVPAKDCKTIQ
jgi:hypothetical protein